MRHLPATHTQELILVLFQRRVCRNSLRHMTAPFVMQGELMKLGKQLLVSLELLSWQARML